MSKKDKIGIIGSGLIGRSWAMLFAGAGYSVMMYDSQPSQLTYALEEIRKQLAKLEKDKLLRGNLSCKERLNLISITNELSEAVKDGIHVQECVPENVQLKQRVFQDICAACNNENSVLCSSSSCILPSKIFSGLDRVAQCIIAHPVNPPSLCPLTEIVPHPMTSDKTKLQTRALMSEIGQDPVSINKEIDGFGLNRLQYAIINEAWRLVQDGYMSMQDVDKIFTSGLGMRYAFIGPFETIHLNADGTEDYMNKYSSSIQRVSRSFGPIPDYDSESVKKINEEMSKTIPCDLPSLNARRQWRDDKLCELAKLKKD